MNILVIDGQGGQLGGQIIKSLKGNKEKGGSFLNRHEIT